MLVDHQSVPKPLINVGLQDRDWKLSADKQMLPLKPEEARKPFGTQKRQELLRQVLQSHLQGFRFSADTNQEGGRREEGQADVDNVE